MSEHVRSQPRKWLSADISCFPKTGTAAAREFFLTYAASTHFAWYVIGMASQIASMSRAARDALHLIDGGEDESTDHLAEGDSTTGRLIELAYHRQFFLETLLARHVENYLNYLSSLLFEIFTHRPECMKSSEKVDLEFVLQHKSMEALVRGIAERKVDALSYSSFMALSEFFEDHFSLAICHPDHVDTVNEGIETRNLAVHNRGIINRRYVEKTGQKEERIGKRRVLYDQHMEALVPALLDAVTVLDRRARKRLKIKGHRFGISSILNEEYEAALKRYERTMERLAKSG